MQGLLWGQAFAAKAQGCGCAIAAQLYQDWDQVRRLRGDQVKGFDCIIYALHSGSPPLQATEYIQVWISSEDPALAPPAPQN